MRPKQPTWREPLQLPPKLAELLSPDYDLGLEYDTMPLFTDAALERTFISTTTNSREFGACLARAFPSLSGERIFIQNDAYESIQRPKVGDLAAFDELYLGATAGVLGPETGEWVVVIIDEWQAIVGARSEADRLAIEREYGARREQAISIIDYWEGFREVMYTDWLLPMLRHVLPADDADAILAKEGRWLLDPVTPDQV